MKTLSTVVISLGMCGSSLHAASIAINFVGANTTVMGSSETAGVVAQQNWNNMTGSVQATPQALVLADGSASGATVAWGSAGTWNTNAADTVGDSRMMRGYLDTSNTSTTTVTVAAIPADFLSTGYFVIVYFDGDNGGNNRTGIFTLNGTTYYGRDAGGANFSGTFTSAQTAVPPVTATDAPAGNHMIFDNLSDSGFTLTAQGGITSDSTFRAPINGIQIVQIPEPSALLLAFAGGLLGLRRRR